MIWNIEDRFLHPPIVGVDIESGEIRIAEVARQNGKYALTRYAAGTVQNGDAVRSLHDLLASHGLGKRDLAIGIASPDLVIHPFQFPKMPKKEMEAAVRLEAEHLIAGLSSGTRLDWHTFGPSKNGSERGVLAVTPKNLLENEIGKVRAAGGNPVVVDVKTLALWNAFSVLKPASDLTDKSTLLIHIGGEVTHLVIASGTHELIFSRDIEVGRLALNQGKTDAWISETRDSLDYARSKSGLRVIHAACLTGVENPGLFDRLKPLLGIPARSWNVLDDLSCKIPVERPEGLRLAVAVGLALRTFE